MPLLELALFLLEQLADAGNVQRVVKGILAVLGHQVNLVLEVGKGVVDRRGRQQQNFGVAAFHDDLIEELVVGGPMISEVVGLVDDYQVVVAEVEFLGRDAVDVSGLSPQVAVVNQRVPQLILCQGVVGRGVVGPVTIPVLAEPFGADNQNPLVAEFVVFDYAQGSVGFTQPYGIGENAAVMLLQLGQYGVNPVPLEPVKGFSDGSLVKADRLRLPFGGFPFR